jgi:hypothetical protein
VLERGLYARVPRPDRVFVLRADPAVLRDRRPKLDAAVLARKTDAVAQLRGAETVEIVDVARPYADVLFDLKRRIFGLL